MTKLEEHLLSCMTVRRWLLTVFLALGIGFCAGWYLWQSRNPETLSFTSAEDRTTQPSKSAADAPTIAAFNSFLTKFVPQMKAQIEAIGDAPFASSGNAGPDREMQSVRIDLTRTVSCTLYSADLKETDSVVNPIVGVALVKHRESWTSKTTNFINSTDHLYTITFGRDEEGKWQVLQAVQKTENVIAFPEKRQSDVGKELYITLDWMKAAAANAQK